MGRSAKVLGTGDVRRLISHARTKRNAQRDKVMVLLSLKAGLRAAEIAGLGWSMVVRPDGLLGRHIDISHEIAKCQSGRRVPMNPELREALLKLHRLQDYPRGGPVIQSERGGHMTARGVVNWFGKVYAELAMDGCSSHSGRRTFITKSARMLAKTGGSLRDVQELAGHRALTTTERYIQGDRDIQRKIVRLI